MSDLDQRGDDPQTTQPEVTGHQPEATGHQPVQVSTGGGQAGDLPLPSVDEPPPARPEDEGRASSPVPQLPVTGDVQVDEALERLHAAQDLPVPEQVEAYTGTHRALQDRLADLEG